MVGKILLQIFKENLSDENVPVKNTQEDVMAGKFEVTVKRIINRRMEVSSIFLD